MSLQNSHRVSDVKVLLRKGADGSGIVDISKTGTSGNVDTYTITLSDGTKYTFTVTNGKEITSVTKTGTSGLVDTYTMTYNDGTSDTFTVTNGKSIVSLTKTDSIGSTDYWTFTYNDGTTDTFEIHNGEGEAIVDREFDVPSTEWVANADATTSTDYPYIWEKVITPKYPSPQSPTVLEQMPIYQNEKGYPEYVFEKVIELLGDRSVDLAGTKYFCAMSKDAQSDKYTGDIAISLDGTSLRVVVQTVPNNGWFVDITGRVALPANDYNYHFELDFTNHEYTMSGTTDFSLSYSLVEDSADLEKDYITNFSIKNSPYTLIEYTPTANIYKANSRPIWQMGGAGDIPVGNEIASIDMITQAVFDSTGVVLYATDQPTENLKLEVKGE